MSVRTKIFISGNPLHVTLIIAVVVTMACHATDAGAQPADIIEAQLQARRRASMAQVKSEQAHRRAAAEARFKVQERRVAVARAEYERARRRAATADDDQSKAEARDQIQLAEARYALARAEFEAAQAEYEANVAVQEAATRRAERSMEQYAAEAVETARLLFFRLKYLSATKAADVIRQVMGSAAPRMAADEQSNGLVVSGTESQLELVRKLIEEIDSQSPSDAENHAPKTETLQLRIVWVVDDQSSEMASTIDGLSEEVIDGLAELGIKSPMIVCQPATSLVIGDDGQAESFRTEVPARLADSWVRLRADGKLYRTIDERYVVRFQMEAAQTPEGIGSGPNRRVNSFQGSIVTSLGHFTVLGTGVVAFAPADGSKGQQFPCAFIIHLDRAQDYPADVPRSSARR